MEKDFNGLDKTIHCWGTSITQGAGSTNGYNYPTFLGEMLHPYGGVRVINGYGIGGQNCEQIAKHFGGIPIHLDLASTVLKANPIIINNMTGKVDDAIKRGNMFLSSPADTTTRVQGGIILCGKSGVTYHRRCAIKRTAVANVGGANDETYQLISLDAIIESDIINQSIFYPDNIENCKSDINIFELCQNVAIGYFDSGAWRPIAEPDFTNLINTTIEQIQGCVDKLEDPKRFIVCGMTGYGQQNTLNNNPFNYREANETFDLAIKNAFPDNYVNQLVLPTQEELDRVGYTLTSNDLLDLADGIMPRGLMASNGTDVIHRNEQGYKLFALRFFDFIISKGWN